MFYTRVALERGLIFASDLPAAVHFRKIRSCVLVWAIARSVYILTYGGCNVYITIIRIFDIHFFDDKLRKWPRAYKEQTVSCCSCCVLKRCEVAVATVETVYHIILNRRKRFYTKGELAKSFLRSVVGYEMDRFS